MKEEQWRMLVLVGEAAIQHENERRENTDNERR